MLLAQANERSETLRGEGDAQAAAIFSEAYGQNEEFFSFWRSLEAYRESFADDGNLMVLEPNSDFFRYLRNPEPEGSESDSE